MNVPSTADSSAVQRPGIEALHRDIGFANTYRLELIKLQMALAGALFAFTITFRPELAQVLWAPAMWLGWLGLAFSMLGGMLNMHGWDQYYISYRDYDHKLAKKDGPESAQAAGKAKREQIDRWRRRAMRCQFGGFALGVAGIAVFAAVNIDGKRPAEPSPGTSTIPPCCAAAGRTTSASHGHSSDPVGVLK